MWPRRLGSTRQRQAAVTTGRLGLGQLPLEPGHYRQLRLVLADTPPVVVEPPVGTAGAVRATAQAAAGSSDPANAVAVTGDGVYPLETPGATQVSLQQGGAVVKSTAADARGAFALQPVAPGAYTLVVAAPGQAPLAVTGVTVAADPVTTVGTAGSALPAAPSAAGTLAGRVATGTTPVEATTHALQALAAGMTIELGATPVDSATGAYSHVLALAPPRVAAWVAPPAALVFAPDTAAAGKVSPQAAGGAGAKTVGPFTLAAGATTTVDVTLP